MRVLVVARCKKGRVAPFITEQVAALERLGIECRFFGVNRKGLLGYLVRYPALKRAIRSYHPNIVHAHYGLCGILANMQRIVPVVTTYHGSDINNPKVFRLSKIAIRYSCANIFVSRKNVELVHPEDHYALIPCGVSLEDYPLIDKDAARRQMGLRHNRRYILFAGAFDNPVKNSTLAKKAVSTMSNVELLELKGYSRHQVCLLLQAVDTFLMTSNTEGSPQVIKEALVCGCPIVSVDVGDVRERVSGLEGCYIVDRDSDAVSDAIESAFMFEGRTKGREKIIRDGLDNATIAEVIKSLYLDCIKS